MRQLLRVLSAFANTPWAIERTTLDAMVEVITRDERASAEDLAALAEARSERKAVAAAGAKENVAVIPVVGVITHRASMMSDLCGGASTQALEQAIRSAVADPSVRSIVLDIDSPGGSVFGVQELANTILEARAQKPIAAIANAQASSAAYWIGSAAHELFVTPSGVAGSIGVYMAHVDTSKADEASGKVTTIVKAGKYKAETEGPLSEEAKAHLQSMVDGYYTAFVKGVAKARNVSVDTVRNGYGQGRSVTASSALEAGMVDGVATLSEVISKYARRTTETANRSRALAEAQIRIAEASLGPEGQALRAR